MDVRELSALMEKCIRVEPYTPRKRSFMEKIKDLFSWNKCNWLEHR